MSIQQSFNQALFAGQIGVGLYANSPAGRERTELQSLQRQDAALEKAQHQTQNEGEEVNYPLAKKQAGVAQRMVELDPSEKNVQAFSELAGTVEEYERSEQMSLMSMTQKQSAIQNQEFGMKERIAALKDLNKTGIMSNTQYKHYAYKVQQGDDK